VAILLSLALALALVFVRPTPEVLARERALESFISTVATHLDTFWTHVSMRHGFAYYPPQVSLVGGGQAANSACSPVPVQHHMYCRRDQVIQLDIGARSAVSLGSLWRANMDFAIVQVQAHEWGHHVQFILGLRGRPRPRVEVELEADCFSGVFTRWAGAQGQLDPGDLDEAASILTRASDAEHGSGQQREDAFRRGFRSRDLDISVCRSS
jgi:uncharacterized protein